jgi:N-methylhydantoinase A
MKFLGVDSGGTFTDFAFFDGHTLRVHKVLSTPESPESAILQGIEDLGVKAGEFHLVHGSTVATNALLEHKGVPTVFITNRGFADILTIGRQNRRHLYALSPQQPSPPVPEEYCLETGGRVDVTGKCIDPLTKDDLQKLAHQLQVLSPQAVAINCLFSFVDDQYEQAIESIVPASMFVSRSSKVLPEYKEYERGIATWVNASLGPLMAGYLQRLEQRLSPSPVAVMQSSGLTMTADQAGEHAVRLLLSGPAGGLAGAQFVANQAGFERLMTFDMGGTSTDVALIDGQLSLTNEGRIGDLPISVPMVDMHTIGAGGGSVATVDAGGLLQVGPESAGANPGPACYGQGGLRATVTDANLVLDRLLATQFLGGHLTLDVVAAEKAISHLATQMNVSCKEAAEGIMAVANEHMTQALRVISIQQGEDPADFLLVSFGGAGGLHVCALADNLGMKRALVPVHAGVLSALGLLVAPKGRDLQRTVGCLLNQAKELDVDRILQELVEEGQRELMIEGVEKTDIQTSFQVDLRYQGQASTLTLSWKNKYQAEQDFQHLHQQKYGHLLDIAVELVSVRVKVTALSLAQVNLATAPVEEKVLAEGSSVISRSAIIGQEYAGPLLIWDAVSTTYVAEHWLARGDVLGNVWLSRDGGDETNPDKT